MDTKQTKPKRPNKPYRKRNPRNKPSQTQSNDGKQHRFKGQRQRKPKQFTNKLSAHFSKRNFDSRRPSCSCKSSLRVSLGLVGVIEALRAKCGKRIEILKGFHCPECYPSIYGVKRNFHTMGIAADIRIENMSINDVFLLAETFDDIKGLGINYDENHVHIDTRKEKERSIWLETPTEMIEITHENREDLIPLASKKTHPIESAPTPNIDAAPSVEISQIPDIPSHDNSANN